MSELFRGRTMVIATMHGKEQVIAPVLEQALKVNCITIPGLDTDQWGTFSGERERPDTPLNTARLKCMQALEHSGFDLAVASEGSFGPHPYVYFVPAGEEFLLLLDKRNGIEIAVRHLDTKVNYAGDAVDTEADLLRFAEKAGFPEHALILRRSRTEFDGMVKGINDADRLLGTFRDLKCRFGGAYAETDMRAHLNPTRMEVIGRAARKLADNVLSRCPNCEMPGFSITDSVPGLPCRICRTPTRSARAVIYTCSHCAYRKILPFPQGRRTEDPIYCDRCNP